MTNTNKKTILVTGGSGYIAMFIMIALLKKGYRVRATLRTMSRQEEVKKMMAQGGISDFTDLDFVQTDLTKEEGWSQAMTGVDSVIHVASPTPLQRPDADDLMVKMAVDGVKFVMKAAKKAGVKRVVLTSASGAVLAGHKDHPEIFTEKDWTNLDAPINAYQRSKTMAEMEFWKLAEAYGIEGASVLPTAVMGPILGNDFSHSSAAIKNMFEGKMPRLLNLAFDYVDVRDVADLHLLALEKNEAIGQRFIATSGQNITYKKQAEFLKKEFGTKAKKVSTHVIPDFLVKILARFDKSLAMPATFLGQNTACSNEKSVKLLGWKPRSGEASIIQTAQTMLDLVVIKVD
ncbi:NAD-dependent epimerase/dehydratase family protein [Lactococcus lactis]|uniref:NAD-dependent epimerase/dehydratase family protein n=1 Tax=Lactococcus lactis TaxID=1358 RepID=UPI003D14BC3D